MIIIIILIFRRKSLFLNRSNQQKMFQSRILIIVAILISIWLCVADGKPVNGTFLKFFKIQFWK